jgi:hypothetical protein
MAQCLQGKTIEMKNVRTGIQLILYQPTEFSREQLETAVKIALQEGLLLANMKYEWSESGKPIDTLYSGDVEKFISEILLSDSPASKVSFTLLSNLKYPPTETARPRDLRFTFEFATHLEGKQPIDVIKCYASTLGDYRSGTAEVLLNIAAGFFTKFSPSYGWIDFTYKPFQQSVNKTLKTKRIQELYWANFFNKEYVQLYGKEFFLNAPVWKVEELENGGMLVQLSPKIAPASEKSIDQIKIAEYFQSTGLKLLAYPVAKYFKIPKVASK